MKNEIEIDFLEPGLAIIISSLENVEEALKNNKELTKTLDKLNEVEEVEDLFEILNTFKSFEVELENQIRALKHKDEFELICNLQIASSMADFLKPDNFLFKFTDSIEDGAEKSLVTQENILEIYKEEIINKINIIYSESVLKFKNIFSDEVEFTKVLKIASEENNLNDLREASKILINILKIEKTVNDDNKYELLKELNASECLINLVDIWNQYEMDFEEE
ncbi:hypothetical protein CK556_01975 [Mesoplasma chauliocola]|uniref:Uncharacterized protein n=1 Tax=Mesoplasma chauliocola TaxID=216427 RepID=A0A249SNE8_9MOLU|nr:hypothetical protein [Mesoplasma chauliocola]ASZ09123.1 hypothetical protein CK556_01975 [Mesoplasma chauliocola]